MSNPSLERSMNFINSINREYFLFQSSHKEDSFLYFKDIISLIERTIHVHYDILTSKNQNEVDSLISNYREELTKLMTSSSISQYNSQYNIKITNEDVINKINQKIKEAQSNQSDNKKTSYNLYTSPLKISKSNYHSMPQSVNGHNISFDSRLNLSLSNKNYYNYKKQYLCLNKKKRKFVYNNIKPSLYTTFLVLRGRRLIDEYNDNSHKRTNSNYI